MMTAAVTGFNQWAEKRDWEARCDPDLAFESPLLRNLLAVWRDQAKGRVAPLREEMTARLLKPFLPSIAVIERLGPERYRVRLMGTRLTQVLGHLQGKILEEEVSPENAARWHALFQLSLTERRPLRYAAPVAYSGAEYLRAEALHLPLSADGGEPTMLLIAAVFAPNAGDDPKKLLGTAGA